MKQFLGLILLSALAACNRAPAPQAEGTATPAPTPAQPAVDVTKCEFCADPATVRVCEVATGVRTTLYWNVADKGVTQVGIYVVDENGKDSDFAQQGPVGSTPTGPWLRPGLQFKLKNTANGETIQALTIEGVDC